MRELRFIFLPNGKYDYETIVDNSEDPDVDLLFTNRSTEDLEVLMDTLIGEDGGYDIRYMTIIDGLLFELPKDFEQFI